MADSPHIPNHNVRAFSPGSFTNTPIEALRNLFVGFCQGLFNAAPPGSYHWDEDDAVTEIIIQDEAVVKEEVLHKRPCITLTRGQMQAYGFGLDDMVSYDVNTGKKTKSCLNPGVMVINCCSRVSLEAENIAWVVYEHVWVLRDMLIQSGRLFDVGRGNTLGSPSPAGSIVSGDSGDEWIVVPVSVPFQFHRMTSVTPLNKQIVNSIQTRIETRLSPLLQQVGPPAVGVVPIYVDSTGPDPLINSSDARGATPDPGGTRQYTLTKDRHPLDPAREVLVRTVRPFRPGTRS